MKGQMLEKVKTIIFWDLLVLWILRIFILSAQAFFIVSLTYFAMLILSNRGKTWIPKVPGIRLYLLFVLYGTFFGLLLNPVRNIVRDLYYILPTLLWIFIVYHLRNKSNESHKDMMATLYLYGGVISTKCIVAFLLNPSFDFNRLRSVFGANVYDVGFILPILIMDVVLLKKTIFSKVWDRFLLIVMILQILLSFGRIALLEPMAELCVLACLAAIYRPENRALAVKIAVLFSGIIIISTILFYLMPDNITSPLLNKFSRIFIEIDASQEISSVGEAMNNWRAYEIQAAQLQWRESSPFVQLFGSGIGKGTYIEYTPFSWLALVQENEVPLLHNGFYSLLSKGGFVAVIALLSMFLGPLILGIKNCAKGDANTSSRIILVSVSAAAMANTYVVRGPVQQGVFLVWAVYLGWYCKELYFQEETVVYEK